MDPKYDISVIVSTWNRAAFLVDALESLKNQDYGGTMQVIVCDDGSTDKTAEVVDSFRTSFAGFGLVVGSPTNEERLKSSRLPIMINRALPLAEGRYVSYLPDDDVYRLERNRLMVEFLDANPEMYLAYHFMKLILISEDKAVVGEAVDLCDPWDSSMEYWVRNIYNRIDHASIVHRNLGAENVLWDENIKYKRCPDWAFLLKILKKGLKVGCVERYLAIGRKIQGMSLNIDGDRMIEKVVEREREAAEKNLLHQS